MDEQGKPQRERNRAEIADALTEALNRYSFGRGTGDEPPSTVVVPPATCAAAVALLRQTCGSCGRFDPSVPDYAFGLCYALGGLSHPEKDGRSYCSLWTPRAVR